MNTLQTLKLNKFDTNQKQTASSIASSIASLNNTMAAALEHQAYARKNPDSVVDADYLEFMGLSVDSLMAQFADVAQKQQDLLAVKDGAMSVDDMISKWNIDLVAYSNNLATQK